MRNPGRRLILTGLAAMMLLGIAYSAAYVALVRKQFSTFSTSTITLGTTPGTAWTFHTPYSSTTTPPTFSIAPGGFCFKPRYTAVLGWPEVNLAEYFLGAVFHPIHWCDRRWLRAHDWDSASIFGCVSSPRFPWWTVQSVP